MSWKKPALVCSEILRLFVSIVTADDRYIRCNMQNFPQQIQTPISQKKKIFSRFFIAYLVCVSNLENLEKKDEHPSPAISEIIDSETVGYLNV